MKKFFAILAGILLAGSGFAQQGNPPRTEVFPPIPTNTVAVTNIFVFVSGYTYSQTNWPVSGPQVEFQAPAEVVQPIQEAKRDLVVFVQPRPRWRWPWSRREPVQQVVVGAETKVVYVVFPQPAPEPRYNQFQGADWMPYPGSSYRGSGNSQSYSLGYGSQTVQCYGNSGRMHPTVNGGWAPR